jgi:AraC family transcriptional regulator
LKAEDERRKKMAEQYRGRINLAVDYIDNNIGKDFTLDVIASVAGFSKYHFHRIFYTFTGESLFQFIQRLRLEKAATLLLNNPVRPVTDIALECGFGNSSSFAKSFKQYFGYSATVWRDLGHVSCMQESTPVKKDRNLRQADSNDGKAFPLANLYIEYINYNQVWRYELMENVSRTVEVKDLPETTLAYVRYVGPYKGDGKLFENLFNKLFQWAGPRNLLHYPETKTIIIYHDNPDITDESKLRVSVSISVPEDTAVDGEIGKMVIPAGKYALARFELSDTEYQEAWDWVYRTWLPESGYQPDDRPCFEMYHNDPKTHPEGKSIVDICIGVKPL